MNDAETLLDPEQCVMLLVDFQAGLAFGVESTARQTLLSNAVALARTSQVFGVPVVVSTSASRVYSGPLFPVLQAALPGVRPGSLAGTVALLSSGDPDPRVPWSRVQASARELERMRAQVELMHHAGKPHTILDKEVAAARSLIRSLF